MIKTTPAEQKINALARFFKLRFEDGEYVADRQTRTRIAPVRRRRAVRRGAVASVVAPAPTRARRHKQSPLARSVYDTLRNLSVGGELDITEACKAVHCSFDHARTRIGTFQWQLRKAGQTGLRFTVRRGTYGHIIVERTA